MRFQIVESLARGRKGATVVEVLRSADEAVVVQVHTGTNSILTDQWAAVKDSPHAAKLLADGVLVDRGVSPPVADAITSVVTPTVDDGQKA